MAMHTLIERAKDGTILDIMQLTDIRDAWRIYNSAARFYRSLFFNCNHDIAVQMRAGGLPPMCAEPRRAYTVQLLCNTSESAPFESARIYTYVITRFNR
jgi:hypothetical protein